MNRPILSKGIENPFSSLHKRPPLQYGSFVPCVAFYVACRIDILGSS